MEGKSKIQWHQGFYSCIELELSGYQDSLVFETEHELSRNPLRMDMLIIRMNEEIEIQNPIASFFRKYNIIEYKSPDDGMTIDDFCKTISYACLYKSLGSTVNEIPLEQITITMFHHRYPREMIRTLRAIGAEITDESAGIYLVKGLFYVPTRIIVTSQIGNEHAGLKMLTKQLRREELARFVRYASACETPGELELVRSILGISMEANQDRFKEIKEGMNMNAATERFFQDELQRRDKENIERGIEQGIERGIEQGMEQGQDELISAISELKAGASKSELSSRGYGKRTIEKAMKCIQML